MATVLAVALAGCSTGTPPANPGNPVNPSTKSLYIIVPNPALNSSNASIVAQFASNSSGNVTPNSTLILPTDIVTEALATDSSGNIYVAGTAGTPASQIFVYAAGSTGSATPVRTVTPTLPSGAGIGSMAVDASGQLYVASGLAGSLQIFAPDATGAATPVRSIQWDPTQFAGGDALAIDGSGFVYVLGYCHCTAGGLGNPTEVLVYAPTASGSVAPVRTIVGTNAEFGLNANSIAVDSTGNLFAIVSIPGAPWINATEIAEFAAGASGNPTPVNTIVGNYGPFGVGPTHLEIDANDNIYAFVQYQNFDLPQAPILATPSVAAFSSTASGNATPTSQFTSTAINDGAYGLAMH